MEEILPKMEKIIIDGKAAERLVPYLPIDRFSKKSPVPTEGRQP
jgi:membrane protease subunit HflK